MNHVVLHQPAQLDVRTGLDVCDVVEGDDVKVDVILLLSLPLLQHHCIYCSSSISAVAAQEYK